MRDDFTDIEDELKRLRPRSLPTPLAGRIAAELAAPPVWRAFAAGWRMWIIPAAAAAALAVAVTSIPFITGSKETAAPVVRAPVAQPQARSVAAQMRPVRATNVLYDAVDEGVVYLDGGTPARRMRLSYIDTITWENPAGGVSLQRSVPREEVYFIPVTAN